MYDIAIIGAGPAGAKLARLIGNQYKVLLLDRRDLAAPPQPGAFTKCCGGLLAPDAQKVLARFGLGVPGQVMTGPQLFVVRTIDLKQSLMGLHSGLCSLQVIQNEKNTPLNPGRID